MLVVCMALSGCLAASSEQRASARFGSPVTTLTVDPKGSRVVSLPGLEYQVLRSGPPGSPHPLRSDAVKIRYIGRLADGSIFSTSASNGAEPSSFAVRTVIPGFSALVQLMRPGDRWRFKIPSYLGYGKQGRRFTPPEPNLKRDIPPESDLVFNVELVSIVPGG